MCQELDRIKMLVAEAFSRSIAGVFAVRTSDEDVWADTAGADALVNLGLACRLQQEAYANLLQGTDQLRASTQKALDSNPPIIDVRDLSLVTLEAILAELYRSNAQWVIALRRNRKTDSGTYWDGLLWNGSALTCMGLAATIQRCLSQPAAEIMDGQFGRQPTLAERTAHMISILGSCGDDPARIGGVFAHMGYEAARLRPRRDPVGDTLDEFLNGPAVGKNRTKER